MSHRNLRSIIARCEQLSLRRWLLQEMGLTDVRVLTHMRR